jgi:hypothetical protein
MHHQQPQQQQQAVLVPCSTSTTPAWALWVLCSQGLLGLRHCWALGLTRDLLLHPGEGLGQAKCSMSGAVSREPGSGCHMSHSLPSSRND